MSNRYRFIDEPDAKGKPQHLHTLDGQPLFGTSTVLSILHKPGLVWWSSGLACEWMGWKTSKIADSRKRTPMDERMTPEFLTRHAEIVALPPDKYMEELDLAYKAHNVKLDKSADAGTIMHKHLENFVNMCLEGNEGKPIPARDLPQSEEQPLPIPVVLFAAWACGNVKRFLASEAYCYSEKLWTGGIVDLMYQDNDGGIALLDFKSAKAAYDTHFLQNSGYDIAISENGILTKEGDLVRKFKGKFRRYAVLPFGMEQPMPQFRDNVDELKAGFEACVALYKLFQQGDQNYG